MDMRVKFVLSCCMFLLMLPLFAAAERQSTASRDIEIDRYLARVNKPYVMSINSTYGDIFDCVRITDQPAFDNHLLKNHTIQMQPSHYPEDASENITRDEAKFHSMRHGNDSCPKGTVPIRRITKEEVLRFGSVEEYISKSPYSNVKSGGYPHEHAVAYVDGHEYHGVKGRLNVWKPYIQRPYEFSLTQVWVIATNGLVKNTVEAGWQIYPRMYGDHEPRLFIFFTNDSYRSACYNLDCGGFIQIDNEIKFGAVISPISSYNGDQYSLPIEIFKDPYVNGWWLKVNNVLVGYWPAQILPLLSHGATGIHWGGEVVNSSPDGEHTATGMGSGYFPDARFRKASYIRNMEVVYRDDKWSKPINLKPIVTKDRCYRVNLKVKPGGRWGTYFYYGGPGRNSECW